MLQFLRKNQKVLFLLITVVVIFSFIFFGTSSAVLSVGRGEEEKVIAIGENGEKIKESDIKTLSHFFQTPQGESFFDKEIIQSRVATILFKQFQKELDPIFKKKWQKVRNFRPYTHPMNPKLSAITIWDEYLPQITSLLHSLKREEPTFEKYAELYLAEKSFPSHFLRRILFLRQMEAKEQEDPRLYQSDLSLFGYHSPREWFSESFIDLVSLYLLKGASQAEKMGIYATDKEIEKSFLQKKGVQIPPTMKPYLAKLVEYQALTQHLSYIPSLDKEFHKYAGEKVVIKEETLPSYFHPKNRYEIALYLTALYQSLSPEKISAENRLSPKEVEKSFPELVYQRLQVEYQRLTKQDLRLQIPTKELIKWQISNWDQLAKKFSLDSQLSQEERAESLSALSKEERKKIDLFSYDQMITDEWIEKALEKASYQEDSIILSSSYTDFPFALDREKLSSLPIGESLTIKEKDAVIRLSVVERGEKELFSLREVFEWNIISPLLQSYLQKQYGFFEREGSLPKGKSSKEIEEKICYTFFGEGISVKEFASEASKSAHFASLIGVESKEKEVTKSDAKYALAFSLQKGEKAPLEEKEGLFSWFTVEEKNHQDKPPAMHTDFAREILHNQAEKMITEMEKEGKELFNHVP